MNQVVRPHGDIEAITAAPPLDLNPDVDNTGFACAGVRSAFRVRVRAKFP